MAALKIAHLIDTFSWGGAQKLLITFAQQARQGNISMLVISLQDDLGNSPVPEILRSLGVKVIILSIRRLYSPRAIPVLLKLIRKEQIDILQTHLSHANALGSISGRLAGVPTIATIHNTQQSKHGHYRSRSIVERLAIGFGANCMIAVGDQVADKMAASYSNKKIHTVPNAVMPGIDLSPENRNQLRKEIMGNSDRLFIITVGRLTAQKAYPDLFNAFAFVLAKHPNIFLAIVGEGNLYVELTALIVKLGITEHVSFLGAREDVPDLLSAADIYVSTSHWEGLSVAMLEAMAAGLPVLATRVGDAPALLSDGRGVLVSANDVSAIQLELENLIVHPETRLSMGSLAKNYVEAMYSPEVWLEKIFAIYEQARRVKESQQ